MGVEIIEKELNDLYKKDIQSYLKECDGLKTIGYKIYRNSTGQHKVVKQKTKDSYGFDFLLNQFFGGVK